MIQGNDDVDEIKRLSVMHGEYYKVCIKTLLQFQDLGYFTRLLFSSPLSLPFLLCIYLKKEGGERIHYITEREKEVTYITVILS